MSNSSAITIDPCVAHDAGPTRHVQRRSIVHVAIMALVLITPIDGFNELTRRIGFSIAAYTGYLVLAVSLTRIRDIFRSQPRVFWTTCLTYFLGTALALVESLKTGNMPEFEVTTTWQLMGLWALVTFCVVETGDEIGMLRLFLISVWTTLFLYVVMYHLGVDVVDNGLRVVFVFGFQTNQAANAAVYLVLVALATFQRWGKWMKRWLVVIALPTAAYVFLLANSKGAVIALAVGAAIILFPVVRRSRHPRLYLVVAMAVSLSLLYSYLGRQEVEQLVERETTRWTNAQDMTDITTHRSDIWTEALQLSIESPGGYGIGNVKYELARRVKDLGMGTLDTHNEFVRIALDDGWLGLLVFVATVFAISIGVFRLWRKEGVVWPFALTMTIWTFFLSGTVGYLKITWLLMGIIVGHSINKGYLSRARFGTS